MLLILTRDEGLNSIMRIGLLFNDKGYSGLDMSSPQAGNPGVGGTQFCYLMLQKYLYELDENVSPIIYHFSDNVFPVQIEKKINSVNEVIELAVKDQIDILIVQNGQSDEWYNILKETDLKVIIWAHNYLQYKEVEIIENTNNIKRVVFVGRQEYDRYIDHDIVNKSTFIFNMFYSEDLRYWRNNDFSQHVTYTGSLIPSKGFHLLAEIWKDVLEEVPNAQLNVIGSGKLYDRNAKLGKYEIAEETYEASFIPYLCDESGDLLPSVHFKGILGEEKIEIYQNTSVGIINPSAITETFGLSAVEMQACGIPIVTKNRFGFPDTIKNRKTGLLFTNDKQFLDYVIRLLSDKDYNEMLGKQAKTFVSEEFSPNKIIEQWYGLFKDILEDKKCEYIKPIGNWRNDYKYLRAVNRLLRKIVPKWPAIIGMKTTYYKYFKGEKYL